MYEWLRLVKQNKKALDSYYEFLKDEREEVMELYHAAPDMNEVKKICGIVQKLDDLRRMMDIEEKEELAQQQYQGDNNGR